MGSRLITGNFVQEFEKRLRCVETMRIASAWMTENGALEALLKHRSCDVQALIGTRGNATSPDSIQSLAEAFEWESLKLVNQRDLFHPKLYLFGYSGGRAVAWVGSANFTGNGMEANTELVIETDDHRAVSTMKLWFRDQWTGLQQNSAEEFETYREQWKKPGRYVGDSGGRALRGKATIHVRADDQLRPPRHQLRGQIMFGPGDRVRYKSAADGLRLLLARLSHGREDQFLRACRSKPAFQRRARHPSGEGSITKYYIVKARTRKQAEKGRRLYDPTKGVKCFTSPAGSHSKGWMSGNLNNEDKWKMAGAAVEVANAEFGDQITLKGDGDSESWPDNPESTAEQAIRPLALD